MINNAKMQEMFVEKFGPPDDPLPEELWSSWLGIWAVAWKYAELAVSAGTKHTIVINCKDCDALFYATSRITAEDVLEVVEYAKQGHKVRHVDPEVVKVEFARCLCRYGQG